MEEADPRSIRHSINLARNGFETVIIRTVDSDVVGLLLSYVQNMMEHGAKNVYTLLVKNSGTEEFDIVKLYNTNGADICMALPFFHAFTGCDTASGFFGKGKSSFWDSWMSYPRKTELTNALINLSFLPNEITKHNLLVLEKFLIYVYHGRNHKFSDINEARITSFFVSSDPNIRGTILSRNALLQHIKRSAYQSGWLWAECLANICLVLRYGVGKWIPKT